MVHIYHTDRQNTYMHKKFKKNITKQKYLTFCEFWGLNSGPHASRQVLYQLSCLPRPYITLPHPHSFKVCLFFYLFEGASFYEGASLLGEFQASERPWVKNKQHTYIHMALEGQHLKLPIDHHTYVRTRDHRKTNIRVREVSLQYFKMYTSKPFVPWSCNHQNELGILL